MPCNVEIIVYSEKATHGGIIPWLNGGRTLQNNYFEEETGMGIKFSGGKEITLEQLAKKMASILVIRDV